MKRSGGSYSNKLNRKHIVLCVTHLEHDFLNHFLMEFYGHQKNQAFIKFI